MRLADRPRQIPAQITGGACGAWRPAKRSRGPAGARLLSRKCLRPIRSRDRDVAAPAQPCAPVYRERVSASPAGRAGISICASGGFRWQELRPRARRRISAAAASPRTRRASLASRCSLVSFSRLSRLQLLAYWPSVVSSQSLDGGPSGIRGLVRQECEGSWLTTQKVMPNSIFINFSQKRRKYWACKRLR